MPRNLPSGNRRSCDHRIVQARGRISSLRTDTLFDSSFTHSNDSPIDLFFNQTRRLHTLVDPQNFDSTLANLILLGYVSAVESYFRAVVRKIIMNDPISIDKSASKTLTYGAALHHSHEMMPEALLEQVSFASHKNVIDCFKEFVGFKGHMANDVDKILVEYENICQLRHCIVHRFSMLGSNNAIKLGLESHSRLLEKPLKLDYNNLQEVFDILDLTVRTCNNFLFLYLINRTAAETPDVWTWDYRKDKSVFLKYYTIFRATQIAVSLDPYEIYKKFRAAYI